MRFAWLDKMAEEGSIRKEALEHIYRDCSDLLEKVGGIESLSPNAQFALNILVGGAGMATVGMGLTAAASAIHEKVMDAKTKAQIDMVKSKVISDPSIPIKDKDKAKARFNEIIRYAPGLGPNEAVMRKLVLTKYQNGLTDQDVQNLINIQVKMTPNSLDYAAASQKHANAKVTPQEVAGECLANAYIQAQEKTAGPAWNVAKDFLRGIAVPVGVAAGIGGIGAIGSAISSAQLSSRIAESREYVLRGAKDSTISENRARAENAFDSLTHFAPHIAADPHAARAFVNKILTYSPDKSSPLALQTSDLKELTEVEKNIGGVSSKGGKGGFFDNLTTALSTSGLGTVSGGIGSAMAGLKSKKWEHT